MMHPRKIRTIATFELLTAVKRPGYLVATFGMPLFVAAYGAIIAIPAYFAAQGNKTPSVYGVVDPGGLVALEAETRVDPVEPISDDTGQALEHSGRRDAVTEAMSGGALVFRPFGSEPEARASLAARTIKGYFHVPSDYLDSGVVEIYAPDTFNMSGPEARNEFSSLLRRRLLAGRVDPRVAERVVRPLHDTRRFGVSRAGELSDGSTATTMVRLAVPLVFMFLFLISVLMTSGYLMQGTATEKENKVVEVLLASADPDEILAGKLVGLGGAGLLQVAVWLTIALGAGVGAVPLLMSTQLQIPWLALAMAIPLFLLAFLFFGSLMLGTGSLGSNMREAQQLAMVWSLTAALPLMMMSVLIREPNGTLAKALTWIPFSSASTLVMRASMDASALAWWEIAGAMLVLVASTWVALRLGARLFRVGLLSSSRPGLKEIIRQARLA
jgi:ABC-2 type transport system permease protein